MTFADEVRLRNEIRSLIQWAEAFRVPRDEVAGRIESQIAVLLGLDASDPADADRLAEVRALIDQMLERRSID